jgi:MFS family permease
MHHSDNLTRMYAVGILAFVLFLSTLVGVPVLPALATELGASDAGIPLVVSSALATIVVAQFFTGPLADRYSRRRLILVGSLLGSVSSFLCAVATHWAQLAALRVLGGVADAVSMPALLAITASLGTERPGKFFGILRGSQGLSFVVGPVVGSAFSLIALRAPFIADGVLSLLAFCAATVLLKDSGKARSQHDWRMFRGIRSAFSDRNLGLFLLMGISGSFGFGILYSFVPTKSELLGLEAWQIGMILGGGALVFSVTSYVVGTLSDRLGRKRFVVASQLAIVAGGVGIIFSDSFPGLAFFYCIFCIGETTTYLLSFVYAAEIFDKSHIGAGMGVFDSIVDLSLFVGPLLAISIYEASHQMAAVFIIAVVPAILAFFVLSMRLSRSTREVTARAAAPGRR